MRNLLWIATKAPYPPVDGGRLLLWNTLRALRAAGHRISLVAPMEEGVEIHGLQSALAPLCRPFLIPVRRSPRWLDGLRARLVGRPLTVVRHSLSEVRQEVQRLLSEESFDVVVAEQVQALSNVLGLDRCGAPLLWRAQNVESDLWRATSAEVSWAKMFLAGEAQRLARWEGEAVAAADGTLALTHEDADRLRQLARGVGAVHHLAAPFDPELPLTPRKLAGEPALVLFGSEGWRPNHSGELRFLRHIWPAVHWHLPATRLHLFGGTADGAEGVELHPRPVDSGDAFCADSVLVVPLWVASGVRMKILEAWARGVAVVATPTAVRGLEVRHGQELLIAGSPEEFIAACQQLAQPEVRARLVRAGRLHLARHHALERFVERFEEVCEPLWTRPR